MWCLHIIFYATSCGELRGLTVISYKDHFVYNLLYFYCLTYLLFLYRMVSCVRNGLCKKWPDTAENIMSHPSAFLSVRLSVCQSVSQAVRPSVRLSVSPSVCQWVRQSIRQSVRKSVSQSIHQSIRKSVSPSVSPSLSQSFIQSANRSWFCFYVLFLSAQFF